MFSLFPNRKKKPFGYGCSPLSHPKNDRTAVEHGTIISIGLVLTSDLLILPTQNSFFANQ
jgi:hypothetical protein